MTKSARRFQLIPAAILAFGIHAQADTQSAKPEQPVTIVGCLVQLDPATLGNPPSSDTGGVRDFFVRTPAIQVPVGTTVTVGGAGSASSSSRGTGATTSAGAPDKTTLYRVTGIDREQLRPHLDHRVELQGRLTTDEGSPANTTARTTVDAAGRATTRVESRMIVAGVLQATGLKMVSASCE